MALAAVRNTLRQDNAPHPGTLSLPVEAATTIWQGGMVCVNAAGNAVPAAATAGFSSVLGRAEDTQANAGAAGDLNVEVVAGVYRYDNNGTSVADADRYAQCYAVDDEAVDLSNTGGRPLAGTIIDVDALGVWVSISGLMTSAGAAASTIDTSSIFHARGASTANVANLAVFAVANDGIVLVEDDLVFLKDQAAGEENGVYVCGAVVAGNCALTRSLFADDGSELHANSIVTVEAGTAGLDTAWKMTNDGAIVIDTTVQVWAQTPFGYGAAGAMVNQTIAASNAGVELVAARVDHNHNFPTAVGAQIDAAVTAPGAGAAATFAASDHVHGIVAPGNGAQIDAAVTAPGPGAAATFAASDHVHGIVAPGNGAALTNVLTAPGPGAAATFAASDHVHGIQDPVAAVNTGSLNAIGASTVFASADHVHAEHYKSVRYVMTTDVPNLAAFVLLQDGVTGAENDLVLLANQTAADENGVYVLGAVAVTAPLTRVAWMPVGATIRPGYTVYVEEGTIFGDTAWFIDVNGAVVVDTDAHVWYPECVTVSAVLAAGTVTFATIPILSVTKTGFNLVRRIFNTGAATDGGYCVTVGGANGVTAGPVGTAAVIIEATVLAGTINVADISTLNFTIINR